MQTPRQWFFIGRTVFPIVIFHIKVIVALLRFTLVHTIHHGYGIAYHNIWVVLENVNRRHGYYVNVIICYVVLVGVDS